MAREHVLVTGGTGFVGRHILNSLIELHPEYRISVLDLPQTWPWKPPRDDIGYVQGDVRSLADCQRVIEQTKPSAVIHTAGVVATGNARYSQKARDLSFSINVGGTENMLAAVKGKGVKAFVLTSSITTVTDDNENNYPNFDESIPLNAKLVYGHSKVSHLPRFSCGVSRP